VINKSDYIDLTEKQIDAFAVVNDNDIELAKLLVSSASKELVKILNAETLEDLENA
jgi:hypothetical protein